MSVDFLSFTVREVETEEDLAKACELRAGATGDTLPRCASTWRSPMPSSHRRGPRVFLCEDKASGAPIGTMRVVDNTRGAKLEIEEFLEVPELDGRDRAAK